MPTLVEIGDDESSKDKENSKVEGGSISGKEGRRLENTINDSLTERNKSKADPKSNNDGNLLDKEDVVLADLPATSFVQKQTKKPGGPDNPIILPATPIASKVKSQNPIRLSKEMGKYIYIHPDNNFALPFVYNCTKWAELPSYLMGTNKSVKLFPKLSPATHQFT